VTPAPTAAVHPLEPRRLLAVTSVAPVAVANASRLPDTQVEPSITVDRTNPARQFLVSNSGGGGILASASADGGATWTPRKIADGTDALPVACCDPSAAFDAVGNLFVTYLAAVHGATSRASVVTLLSTDAGATFRVASVFAGEADRPTSDAGAGSVWVAYQQDDHILLAGAAVKGVGKVGKFKKQSIPAPDSINVADVAVGPDGQVAVAYQTDSPRGGTSSVIVHVDPDGRGGKKAGPPVSVALTTIDGFDAIPAQPQRTVDASVTLAWDRSPGPFQGRLYIVYGDEIPNESNNTEVLLRYSDDGGSTWSDATKVNNDTTTASQFFPRVAVDDATGAVAVGFYDCREDDGTPGPGGLDPAANDEPQFYAAVGSPEPGGVLFFFPNTRLSAGPSSALDADEPNEFGDYVGVDAFGGAVRAAWADNSAALPDNPVAARTLFDIAAGGASYALTPDPQFGEAPTVRIVPTKPVRRGMFASFTVEYRGDIDSSTVTNPSIVVNGPNGFAQVAEVRSFKRIRGGWAVRYRVSAPGLKWDAADRGSYFISLGPLGVMSASGVAVAERPLLGRFDVVAG
jgi:hypothetical protein